MRNPSIPESPVGTAADEDDENARTPKQKFRATGPLSPEIPLNPVRGNARIAFGAWRLGAGGPGIAGRVDRGGSPGPHPVGLVGPVARPGGGWSAVRVV
jgi:hypothetical protein